MPLELRWFKKDMTDYRLALDWFKSIEGKYIKENIREDRYIFLPNCRDIGIKLRPFNHEKENQVQFRLEIKWRKEITEFVLSSHHIYGIIEDWFKWGCSLEGQPISVDGRTYLFSSTNNRPIIKIKKSRFLRRYLFLDNEYRTVDWIDSEKDEGLQLEITKIVRKDISWWSVGFEQIGKNKNRLKFLTKVKEIIKDSGIKLENKNSMGYPEWISLNSKFLLSKNFKLKD